MANPEYTEADFDAPISASSAVSSTMGWIGAACSVALLTGLGWWGIDLATRDARGVPVVAALEGPARLAPDEPGGYQAAHQGLAVTSVSSRNGDVTTDELRLAPAPTTVAAEDQPMPELRPRVGEQGLRDAVNSALQDAGVVPAPASPGLRPAGATPAGTMPRPRPRPDMGVVSRAAVTTTAPLAPMALDMDPSSIPPGTRLVQLGAFNTPEIARAEWDQTVNRFGMFLGDRQRVIEPTEVGGRTLYRLRVHGFDDLPEARRFCAALTAENADCIPVLVR